MGFEYTLLYFHKAVFFLKGIFCTHLFHVSENFSGGVHDMASWTNEIWQHAETMLEHGTEACQVPKNTLFIKCNKTDITRQPRIGGLRNPGKPYQRVHHNLTYNDVIRKRTKHGMILFPKQNTFDLIRIPRVDALNKYQREFIADDGHGSPALRPYSETGRSVFAGYSPVCLTLMLLKH